MHRNIGNAFLDFYHILIDEKISVLFDIIYFISCLFLASVEAIMGIFYLESPAKITFPVIVYVVIIAAVSLVMFFANVYVQTRCSLWNQRRY